MKNFLCFYAWFKKACRWSFLPLYLLVVYHAVFLCIHMSGVDFGFRPKTTLFRISHNPELNLVLLATTALGSLWLILSNNKNERRRATALAVALSIFGVVTASEYDPGLGFLYVSIGLFIFRWSCLARSLNSRARGVSRSTGLQ